MSCLIWNCRGLGNQSTIRNLVWLIKHKKPTLVFLMETKLLGLEWNPIVSRLGMHSFFSIDCDISGGGRKGGLGLLWMGDFDIIVHSSSLHHINANVVDSGRNLAWRFCGIYGWAESDKKYLMWQLIRELKDEGSDHWICAGDFNEILFGFEKTGGIVRDSRKMEEFRDTIDECGLMDMGYNGSPYTWVNNQSGSQSIQERLDRFFASNSWTETTPTYRVEHLLRKSSDHCPVWLEFEPQIESNFQKRKFFRMEAMWFKDSSCLDACRTAWDGNALTSSKELHERLASCGNSLTEWEKQKFGNITKKLREFRKELKELQLGVQSQEVIQRMKVVEIIIDDLLEKEEVMWKQRSKALWLMEGDRNSAYFHRAANGRKHRNKIRKITDPNGVEKTKHEDIEGVFRNYFQELFRSQGNNDMNEVLGAIENCVTPEINDLLAKPYTEHEIVDALSQMHPLKSPGPDDALSALLRRAENQNQLHGVRVCRSAPSITHLFFADDSLIFGRATAEEIDTVKRVLTVYGKASGQKVNLEKSDISFNKGLQDDLKQSLATRLGVRCVEKHGLYLGIPSVIGKNKKEIFQMLEDRVRKKVKDWKRRVLSGAGKFVMIKSVLQAIPTYLMSCFLLPNNVCQRLDAISSKFFWSHKEDGKGIHWKSWHTLCGQKQHGGLGYRDTSCFNRALLAKQSWRLIHNESSLLSRSLKARYYPRELPVRAIYAHNPSYTWRSIMAGFEVVRVGAIWRVGNGSSIRIGIDRWVPSAPNFRVGEDLPPDLASCTVSEFIDYEAEGWNEEALSSCLNADEVQRIMAIPVARNSGNDVLRWHHSKTGFYTVKTGYQVLRYQQEQSTPTGSVDRSDGWKWLWRLPVIPKVHLFMWKCFNHALPTKMRLLTRSIPIDTICERCGDGLESIEHVLRDCRWSTLFWAASPLRMVIDQPPNSDLLSWIEATCNGKPKDFQARFATSLWAIWYARNMLIFQNKTLTHADCFLLVNRHMVFEGEKKKDQRVRETVKWKIPPLGTWKINVDAAVKEGQGTGIGVVIRDHRGKVVGSQFRFFRSILQIEEAEAMAAKDGVKLAKSLAGRDCILETDCQILYNRLIQKRLDLSYASSLICDILEFSSSLSSLNFSWVSRSANTIAHQLAHLALFSFSSSSLLDDVPNTIVFPSSEALPLN